MFYTKNEGKQKKKIENQELTDESFGVWKLDGNDSGETPTIKHRWNRMMSHLLERKAESHEREAESG